MRPYILTVNKDARLRGVVKLFIQEDTTETIKGRRLRYQKRASRRYSTLSGETDEGCGLFNAKKKPVLNLFRIKKKPVLKLYRIDRSVESSLNVEASSPEPASTVSIEQELEDHLQQEPEEHIEQELEDHLGKEPEERIEQELEDHLGKEPEEHIEQEPEEHIEQELEDHLGKEPEEHIEQESEEHLKQESEDHIEQEPKDRLEQELEENLQQEPEEHIEKEHEDRLGKEPEDHLEQEPEDTNQTVESNLQEKMSCPAPASTVSIKQEPEDHLKREPEDTSFIGSFLSFVTRRDTDLCSASTSESSVKKHQSVESSSPASSARTVCPERPGQRKFIDQSVESSSPASSARTVCPERPGQRKFIDQSVESSSPASSARTVCPERPGQRKFIDQSVQSSSPASSARTVCPERPGQRKFIDQSVESSSPASSARTVCPERPGQRKFIDQSAQSSSPASSARTVCPERPGQRKFTDQSVESSSPASSARTVGPENPGQGKRRRPENFHNYALVSPVNVSHAPEPPGNSTDRKDFLKYSCPLSLDPNTTGKYLYLLEENRKVVATLQNQHYPDHPERFTLYEQVLSRESLPERCYFEVEWVGYLFGIAVSYKDINRKKEDLSVFGYNDKSWRLDCEGGVNGFTFTHNSIATYGSLRCSSRVGVYVDRKAGILSFYSVANDAMTLLHSVQTTFTKPLYAGIWLFGIAEFCNT